MFAPEKSLQAFGRQGVGMSMDPRRAPGQNPHTREMRSDGANGATFPHSASATSPASTATRVCL